VHGTQQESRAQAREQLAFSWEPSESCTATTAIDGSREANVSMTIERAVDVCIVGLGGVGAMAAAALTAGGREVLALEAGPARTGREYIMDEIESSMVRNPWGAAKFNHEVPTWRPNPGSAARPTPYTQRMANGVGGSSLAYAMISFRYHPDDFRVRSATLARYGPEAVPAGADLRDWPVTYEDLEPYYDLAEGLLGVSGQAGNLRGQRLAGGNPFEGPRQYPYPLPPLRTSGLGELFRAAAIDAGCHPFPMPAAILSRPYRGRAACTYCSFCSRQGCHVGAKGSTFVTVLPQALVSGRLEIRTECRAMRVATDARGRATGVEYLARDGMHFQPANVVLLAAYTFENVRLLLLSRCQQFPDGLGNRAGQVGRYYMARQGRSVSGLFERRRLNRFIGPSAQGQTIDDFNADNFDHAGIGFIRGGRVTVPNNFVPIFNSATIPPDVPRWGRAYKAFLARAYQHIATVTVDAETLPYDANTLDLDPHARDPQGIPVIRITFDAYDNERRVLDFLQQRADELLGRMGADRTWRTPATLHAFSTHDVGGTRMGIDPSRSVVDAYGRLHDLPNVFVLGGSTFPTHGGLNPTLTMQALALRTAAHIARVDADGLRRVLVPAS